MSKIGHVTLVGAGPGDPGLITVKGLKAVQTADSILYDRLIPMELLDEAKPGAELVDVGKVSFRPQQKISQEGINALIVDRALAGKDVVRLKGGDPFVFGRGGEEAQACVAEGIPFTIVPGVSSAIAVPAYAGIPVTQRGLVSAFTVFAGHEDPTKPNSTTDFEALARIAKMGTLVLLMGVVNLGTLIEKLITGGLPADTPAATIEQGTTTQQRVVMARLADLADCVQQAGIAPPATTVIGAVAGLRDEIRWFAGEVDPYLRR